MPDMSNAPADIQAIMKKVMSGGIPTQDEAKRLGAYMSANKGAIAKSATAYGDSMKKQAAAAKTRMSGKSDQNACPTKVALAPTLAHPADEQDRDGAPRLDSSGVLGQAQAAGGIDAAVGARER